ncbi:MAG: hypothetical protein H6993_03665 [Pseudomonadales bacterium]|nr:hypothetical protein [Pseudomonadales bacterium]MCP5183031.1 hypothetical protein [Pseudomonadales bacterium]
MRARLGDYSLRSFAFAGECQLDAFVARAMAEERADIISIKPGINIMTNASMSPRTFHSALHGFLDILRDAGPETPIVVISPIFQAPLAPAVPEFPPASLFRRLRRRWKMNASGARPETAIGREGRKLTSPIIADLIQDVVTARQRAGDNTLRFLDGFSLLGPDQEALLPDGIHPSTEGHRLIGERFARLVFSPTVRPRQRRRA